MSLCKKSYLHIISTKENEIYNLWVVLTELYKHKRVNNISYNCNIVHEGTTIWPTLTLIIYIKRVNFVNSFTKVISVTSYRTLSEIHTLILRRFSTPLEQIDINILEKQFFFFADRKSTNTASHSADDANA